MRVIASDESRARRLTTAIFHGTSPWGERSSTEAVAEVQMVIAKGKLGQKSQQRRVMWPLREGREIWGVDGAFASMTWRRHCVRDGVAPSANELAWFYMGSDSVRSGRSRSEKLRSVELPMKENLICLQIPVGLTLCMYHYSCTLSVTYCKHPNSLYKVTIILGTEFLWINKYNSQLKGFWQC